MAGTIELMANLLYAKIHSKVLGSVGDIVKYWYMHVGTKGHGNPVVSIPLLHRLKHCMSHAPFTWITWKSHVYLVG